VLRQVLMRLSQEPRLREMTVHNGMMRSMARRFVAGEELSDAIAVVRQINRRGMTATLDHLGENVSSPSEAAAAADDYCRALEAIAQSGVNSNVSVKLTHMGLDLGEDVAYRNTLRIVEAAAGTFVRIDMESSEYVDRTLAVFRRLFDEHKNVGVVLQSALYRSEADAERLVELGARVRLVKGAYLEPPSVAYENKSDVDAAYVRLMQLLLLRGNYPAIATHDPRMIEATTRYALDAGIDRTRYEFQMLYGIRRDLQSSLVAQGYRMRVYVPYGTEWYPYLMRRMAERPANLMFVVGNIAREGVPGRH
jgi:proline dehydrogenase